MNDCGCALEYVSPDETAFATIDRSACRTPMLEECLRDAIEGAEIFEGLIPESAATRWLAKARAVLEGRKP